jgi:hypothetical protein
VGAGGREREGELTSGIQFRRQPSPRPRAQRGRERDGRERELCTGELNEGKRDKERGRARMWEGQGRHGRAGQGQAKLV